MQAGPDAVYCGRRCADLELIDRLAVIRASVSAAGRVLPDRADKASIAAGMLNSAESSITIKLA